LEFVEVLLCLLIGEGAVGAVAFISDDERRAEVRSSVDDSVDVHVVDQTFLVANENGVILKGIGVLDPAAYRLLEIAEPVSDLGGIRRFTRFESHHTEQVAGFDGFLRVKIHAFKADAVTEIKAGIY